MNLIRFHTMILIMLFIFIMALLLLGIYADKAVAREECEKLEDYGYKVRVIEKFLDSRCEVKTQRGVWIDSRDFNIASVEEFVRR